MESNRPPLLPRERYKSDEEYNEAKRLHYGVSKEQEDEVINKKRHNKQVYTQGVYCEDISTQYGMFIKVSIQVDKFITNNTTPKGYINFIIKRSKSGKPYAENAKY